MKKGTVSFLSIVGTLAVLSGMAAGLYYGSKKVRDAADGLIDSIKGDSSLNSGAAETVTSSDGKLAVYMPSGHVFRAHSLSGSTKTVVATLSGNPDNNKIGWASSDETKVSVTKETISGGAATITLISFFDGEVTLTATAYGDPSVSCQIAIDFTNFIRSAYLVGLCSEGYFDCYAPNDSSNVYEASGQYMKVANGIVDYSCSSVSGIKPYEAVYVIGTATGSFEDLAYLPDKDSLFTVSKMPWVGSVLPVNCHLTAFTLFSDSGQGNMKTTGEDLSLGTFGDWVFTLKTTAYVAPTGLTANSSSVVF